MMLLLAFLLFHLNTNFHLSSAQTVYVYVSQHGVPNTTCCASNQDITCKNLTIALECIKQVPPATPVSVQIDAGQYNLSQNQDNIFTELTGGLSIVGNISCIGCIEILCEKEAGLSFVHSNNIMLANLVLINCGILNNSTSINFTTMEFIEVHSALYFLFCTNVTLTNLVIQHSDGVGLIMYSTVGTVTISDSKFLRNRNKKSLSGGGGIIIEFAYCIPGNRSCFKNSSNTISCFDSNVPVKYSKGSNYYIFNTIFMENIGSVSDPGQFTFILPQKCNHIAFGRGGGLSVFFKGYSSNNTILVEGCNFTNNTAVWGSGIFVEHHDWSSNNRVNVSNTTLQYNQCKNSNRTGGTGGGGSRVGYIFFNDTHVKNGSISFENSQFINNSAYFGGGLSFYAAREPTESSPTNILKLMGCIWEGNIARAGSAVDVSVWHSVTQGIVAAVMITNCEIYRNSGEYTNQSGTVVGIGAMYLDSIPVYFGGNIIFESNTHSALAALNAGIHVTTDSSVNFTSNSGRTGGAVALFGSAFLEASPQSYFYFINNTAYLKGGAIFHESFGHHDLINSRNCIIRYSSIEITPKYWQTLFYFYDNRVNEHNNSIYATALLPCLWGGSFGSVSTDFSEVFCWSNSSWNYTSGNCTSDIQTTPAGFNSTVTNNSLDFNIIPGQRKLMPIYVYDDRQAIVTNSSVFIARSLSPHLHIDKSTKYISDNHIEVHADPLDFGEISLETDDSRVVQAKLSVGMLLCPAGMIKNGSGSTAICMCGGNYGGRVICMDDKFQAKLQRGAWIGYYVDNSVIITIASDCPFCASISNDRYFPIPSNASKFEGFLCHKIHRQGTACGKCILGYGPSLNDFTCIKCSDYKYNWMLYLVVEIFPVTIFFILVILYDIRATSAPANAFVFFAQVLPTAFTLDGNGVILLKHGNTLKQVYSIPYQIWNLKFFGPLQDHVCLSPNLSTLQIISVSYVTAVYPLLLIICVSIFVWLYEHNFWPILLLCRPMHRMLARFQRVFNIKRSLIHAFATFVLLSYTRFTLVSFFLLTPTFLIKDDGSALSKVAYYDGTIDYLSKPHIPYAIMAVLVLVTFVAIPPIFLSVPSILHNLKKFIALTGSTRYLRIMDIAYISCEWGSWPKVQQFLAAFHGCYKDGTTNDPQKYSVDYRWFAGLYFILRIIIFAVYALTSEWFLQYAILQFVCILGAIFFLVLQPYQCDYYNKLDATMFALLIAINTLTMYNYHVTEIGYTPSELAFVLQYVLVLIPIVYMSTFVAMLLRKRYCCRLSKHSVNAENEEPILNGDEDNCAEQDDYLTFMQQTGRLEDINQYRPASNSPVNSSEHEITTDFGTRSPLVSDSSTRDLISGASNTTEVSKEKNTSGYGSIQQRNTSTCSFEIKES